MVALRFVCRLAKRGCLVSPMSICADLGAQINPLRTELGGELVRSILWMGNGVPTTASGCTASTTSRPTLRVPAAGTVRQQISASRGPGMSRKRWQARAANGPVGYRAPDCAFLASSSTGLIP
jgi:hypothetical protein